MARFIFNLCLFLILALLLYILLVIVWAKVDYSSFIKKNIRYELNTDGRVNSNGHMFSRAKEVKSVKEIDLLMLGASQAYRGLDTRIFDNAGYNSFNIGSSNQTPMQSEVLLNRYLNKLNPKLIIYIAYPEAFTMDGVESTLNILANDQIDFGMVKLALSQRNIMLFNTLIYGLYRDLFKLNNGFEEPVKKGNDTYIKGGYVEKELLYYGHHNFEKSTWIFNQSQFKAFEKVISFINKRKIRLVLVQAPTSKSFYSSHTNNAYFDDKMKQYGEYYNFNNIINLDDSLHFYDEFHLNQAGVSIFNDKLIEVLKEKGSQ